MRCVSSILLLCFVTSVLADDAVQKGNGVSAEATPQQAEAALAIEAAIERLASPAFETRRNAFLELWKAGDSILPSLELALTTEDRQRKESLGTLQLLLQLDIAPGQDSDSLRLIELLNDFNPQNVVEICELQHWDLAVQLVKTNSALHEALSDAYGRYTLNKIVDVALKQGDLSKAWPIVCATISPDQAAWIANKLQLEVPSELSDTNDVKAMQSFHRGEIDAALELVESQTLRTSMLARSFRWQDFLEEEVQTALIGDQPSLSQTAARAALLEVAGSLEEADDLWNEILAPPNATKDGDPPSDSDLDPQSLVALEHLRGLSDPLSGSSAQLQQLTLALLMSGRVEPVGKFLEEKNKAFAYSFYSQMYRYVDAFEQIGLKADLTNFDEWLEKQEASLPKSLLRSGRSDLDLFVRTALTLLGLGHDEKASQMLNALVNIAQAEPRFENMIWLEGIVRWFGRHESRVLCLRIAEENYSLMSAECAQRVIAALHSELGSAAAQLFATAPNHPAHPGDSPWTKLERLRLWDREYFGPDAEAFIARWLRDAKQGLAQEGLSADHLSQLGKIAHDFGFDDLALELLSTDLRDFHDAETLNLHWLDAAAIYNEQLKPQQALPLLSALRAYGYNLQAAYIAEVDTLIMAGEYDQATMLERSRWLRPLATEGYGADYSDFARHYSDLEQYARAMEYAEPAFLLTSPNSQSSYWAATSYAQLAKESKDFEKSADVQRATLVESLQPYSAVMEYMMTNGYLSSIRIMAQNERLHRAIDCIDRQDFSTARRHLVVAQRLQPQDIEVVVECYPRLIQAGQIDFAEELLSLYETVLLEQIAAWPNDATALNNLAWMYSQCDCKLDEALELAKQGVALAPSSPVFLDTLAEVEYRRGQVDNALGMMRNCVRLDPRDTHYRQNIVRFRRGEK